MAGLRGAALAGLGAGLLAAGFGLGAIVASSGPPPEAPRPVEVAVPAPAPPPPPARPAHPPLAPAPAAPAPEPEAPPLSPDDRDALRAILDRAPSTSVPSGTGVITGRVKKEDGSPLPGVEVTCTPQRDPHPRPTPKPGEKPPEKDPVDTAVDAVLWQRWTLTAKRTATTDAAGEFRLEGLADRRHQVSAVLAGWQIQSKDYREMHQARPGMDLNLVAKLSVEVRVEITCADGPLPDNLQIRWTEEQGRGGFGFNADYPIIRLEPGTHVLTAFGGDGEEYRSDPQTVVVPGGSAEMTAAFVLRGRPGIRGKVLFPSGEEWEHVQVLLRKLGPEEKPSASALQSSQRDFSQYRRLPGNGYAFPNLAPGRYAVGVLRGGQGTAVAIEEVQVVDAPVVRDLRVPAADPAEFLLVRVLGPGGETVTDFTVTTAYRTKNSSNSGGSATAKRPDGSRLVLHHGGGSQDDPEGMYSITVQTRGLGGATLEYRKGERSEWTVRLDEPARVEARVTGHQGTKYDGRLSFQLSLAADRDGSRQVGFGREDAKPNEQGVQVFAGVQPGEFVLHLMLTSGHMALPIARVPIAVRAGRNEISVPLPDLHEVTVTGAEGHVQLRSTGEGRYFVSVQSTEGRALLDGLPDGEYQVSSGRKNQKFRVPGTTKIDL